MDTKAASSQVKLLVQAEVNALLAADELRREGTLPTLRSDEVSGAPIVQPAA